MSELAKGCDRGLISDALLYIAQCLAQGRQHAAHMCAPWTREQKQLEGGKPVERALFSGHALKAAHHLLYQLLSLHLS